MNYSTIILLCLTYVVAECAIGRERRASESTTEVVGLALQKGTTAEDVQTLKKEGKGGKARGKRQLGGFNFGGPLGSISVGTNGAQLSLGAGTRQSSKPTQTQQNFLKISFDFDLASKLKEAVSSNPILSKTVVVNEKGVTCEELCPEATNGFATIGICTSKYCTCGSDTVEKQNCESTNDVFDILELKCAKPADTILCSDDE
ncbi:unnamed protein product [Allacma fusca]|uniref:Uncharacterized protein n=1 Tax=Allacma fusca TaxID=39272 RepID=A0A8J2KGT4_9HEXA|nr:unnamed protein product [Allacma fusca]